MNNLEKKFDFVFIGSPKCGSTYIYQLLKEHPEVGISSSKDGLRGGYFKDTSTEEQRDQILYFSRKNKQARVFGEFREGYIKSSGIEKNILKDNPEMKILFAVRNPYERAFSNYRHGMLLGHLNGDYLNTHITASGYYYKNIKPYVDAFGKEKILLLSFDELKNNPAAYREKLYSFLNINTDFSPSTEGKKLNDTRFKGTNAGKFFHKKLMPFLKKIGLKKILKSSAVLRSIFYKTANFIGEHSSINTEKLLSKKEFLQSIEGIYDEDLKKLKDEFGITL
jgi:hypothetical protein